MGELDEDADAESLTGNATGEATGTFVPEFVPFAGRDGNLLLSTPAPVRCEK
ncbi:hypothetical protein NXT08_23870 (plasmid) [Rhodococcus pyridinivorans]|uniref:hypothetical protein n=1 Tax=Rhodococcus TaxID=1827 RepID=UPI000A89AB00|nr:MULTISPECIES: hypothetical protein [Rhodococcus]MCT7294234.1 hypothetical protein [Rhodococcus sp. PAE-6]QXU56506.1 hypothetical protein KXC42_25405 [Rhodococcus sp. LW-XY12]UQB75873.1 hypothetical protein KI427_27075 [Rhodococcus ruber]UVT27596.1 hypothetical protein NXT08_23870 [Rhodococcus pyridinivorans]WML66240.1 hypothetical protein QNA09_28525 [Rhodococcus sp. AH-ZY2]